MPALAAVLSIAVVSGGLRLTGCFESGPIGTHTAGLDTGLFDVGGPDSVNAGDASTAPACLTSADCTLHEDGDPCTGTLRCDGGECQVDPATVVTCPDLGDPCIGNSCDPATGACVQTDLCVCAPLPEVMVCGASRKLSPFDAGATVALDGYPCPQTTAPGPEHVLLWSAPNDMVARLEVTSGAPLGLWILHGADVACEASECVNSGADGVSFLATAGVVYGLAVEHDPGSGQAVTVKLSCNVADETDCGNGVDEDLDLLVDCAEPVCAGVGGCPPTEELLCDDGKDDDVDGLTDCHDDDCALVEPCRQACSPSAPTLRCDNVYPFNTGGGKLEIDTYWGCGAGAAIGKGLVLQTDLTPAGKPVKVNIQLASVSDEVSMWVLEDTGQGCAATACVASGTTSVSFDADPASGYHLSVDTPFISSGVDVELSVSCVEKP